MGIFPDKTFAAGFQFTIILCLCTIRKCCIISGM